jgi:hypothetical protein
VEGVLPPELPAQALSAIAAIAAIPTALEVRPKRIPPPFFEWKKPALLTPADCHNPLSRLVVRLT